MNYEIHLYEDESGHCPILTLVNDLDEKAELDKNARIQLKQIDYAIARLRVSGTRCGEELTKHIEDDIWEIRPGNNRIFFFGWKGSSFVLLHCFRKKTQKTPRREIDQAKREMQDWKIRHD